MSDVQINVIIDGKPAFAHGAVGSLNPLGCICLGLQAAQAHFGSLRDSATLAGSANSGAAGSQSPTTKGPSL